MREQWPDSGTWLVALVVGTLGNADLLLQRADPRLVALAAGNLLAMLCLPLDYLQHHAARDLFTLARDTAVGVQLLAVVLPGGRCWGAALACAALLWPLQEQYKTLFHCAVLCGLPMVVRRDRTSLLVTAVLAANYLPLHGVLLLAWTGYLVTTTATYLPLYTAAGWIPVTAYFLLPDPAPADDEVHVTSHPFGEQRACVSVKTDLPVRATVPVTGSNEKCAPQNFTRTVPAELSGPWSFAPV